MRVVARARDQRLEFGNESVEGGGVGAEVDRRPAGHLPVAELLELGFLVACDVEPTWRPAEPSVEASVRIFPSELAESKFEQASVDLVLELVEDRGDFRKMLMPDIHTVREEGRSVRYADLELDNVFVEPDLG